MNEAIITLKNVKKTYKKNTTNIMVLNDVNYTFEKNNLYFIMGESGSGKSTLLNIMAGLLTIDSGKVLINQKSIFDINNKEQAKIRNRNIGIGKKDWYKG